MLICLDSNIICADYKMKSPSFEVAQKSWNNRTGTNCC